jgi:hypothetical protein
VIIDLPSRCNWFLAATANLNLASSINLVFKPDFREYAPVFHLTSKLFGSFGLWSAVLFIALLGDNSPGVI